MASRPSLQREEDFFASRPNDLPREYYEYQRKMTVEYDKATVLGTDIPDPDSEQMALFQAREFYLRRAAFERRKQAERNAEILQVYGRRINIDHSGGGQPSNSTVLGNYQDLNNTSQIGASDMDQRPFPPSFYKSNSAKTRQPKASKNNMSSQPITTQARKSHQEASGERKSGNDREGGTRRHVGGVVTRSMSRNEASLI